MNMFSIYTYWTVATRVYTVIFLKTPAMGDGLHELLKLTQNCWSCFWGYIILGARMFIFIRH